MTPEQIKRGLRISIIEGGFATLHFALTTGMFLTGLALWLGANSFQIALLSAIPALSSGFGFLAGHLVRRFGTRKLLSQIGGFIGRTLYILPVPFLLLGRKMPIILLFLMLILSSIIMTVAGTIWTYWMSDLVPEESRGSYFGFRNAIHGMIAVLTAYVGGRALDAFKAHNQEHLGYGLGFGLAVLFGWIASVIISWQPEMPVKYRPPLSLKQTFLGPLREKSFRRFILFMAGWCFLATIGGPFYLVHMMRNLHFSFAAIGLYSLLTGVTGIAGQLFWGKMIDRFGARPITVLTILVVNVLPLLWLLATPSFRLPIYLDAILNGAISTGAGLGFWSLMFNLAEDPAHKESYFATYFGVTGLCSCASSLLSGVLAQLLAGFHLTIFGRSFINFHLLFLLAIVTRFSTLPLLLRVSEPGSDPISHTARVLGAWAAWRINTGRDAFLKILGLGARD